VSDIARISVPPNAPDILGTRLLDAPRELVVAAFASPDRLARWFGPKGSSLTSQSFEFAPGGVWRFVMHERDGRDYEHKAVFREILRPERISYIHPGEDGEAVQMEVTIAFSQEGAKTRIDWRARFPTLAERDRVEREGAAVGLAEILERLGDYVASAAIPLS
jgi:uncharacterized protein YndB with AHSA1/START domain